MEKLAINGGTPVFAEKKLGELIGNGPHLFPETEQHLIDVYRSKVWGIKNEFVQKLSKEFAKLQDAEYSVWMANGTTTLECALLALGIGPGDEVIVPAVTWIATATSVTFTGAKPVIVDVDPDTICIDPAKLEAAITPRTKAVIPVHLFGAMADMDAILPIAKKHDLKVVEDCAHAHGSRWKGKGAGSFGQIGSFSFQLSKLMTAGEGGCCTTNDPELADRIFRLSHIGNSQANPGTRPPEDLLCRNYRFTAFQAAIIYDQLQHYEAELDIVWKNMQYFKEKLAAIPAIHMQDLRNTDRSGFYFPILLLETEKLQPGIAQRAILDALQAEGVPAYEAWGCPLYKSLMFNLPADKFVLHPSPNAEDICYKRLVQLPHPLFESNRELIDRTLEAIDKVMNAYLAN